MIARSNRRRFDANYAHAEQDQAAVVGHGQVKIGGVPEMLGDIGQELPRVFDGSALRFVNARKL